MLLVYQRFGMRAPHDTIASDAEIVRSQPTSQTSQRFAWNERAPTASNSKSLTRNRRRLQSLIFHGMNGGAACVD
jgi:hypothetical protein